MIVESLSTTAGSSSQSIGRRAPQWSVHNDALLPVRRTLNPTSRALSTSVAATASSFQCAEATSVPPATPHTDKHPPPITVTSLTSTYTTTPTPTPPQLQHANRFFTTSPRHHIFSSPLFRHFHPSTAPEIALLGRSNVGKSTLLNALLAGSAKLGVNVDLEDSSSKGGGKQSLKRKKIKRLAEVSQKPGRTRTMNAYVVGNLQRVNKGMGVKSKEETNMGEKKFERWEGRGALVVVDMPGYGSGSRADWGEEILKYLKGRRQLRRTFILIDSTHGLKPTDRQLLELLRTESIPHQIILVKADLLLFSRSTLKRCKGRVGLRLDSRDTRTSSMDANPNTDTETAGLRADDPAIKVNTVALQRITKQALEAGEGSPGWRGVKAVGDVIAASGEVRVGEGDQESARVPLGVDALRWAMLQACGMDGSAMGSTAGIRSSGWDYASDGDD